MSSLNEEADKQAKRDEVGLDLVRRVKHANPSRSSLLRLGTMMMITYPFSVLISMVITSF